MRLAELQDWTDRQSSKRVLPPKEELERLQAMMPIHYGSLDDLPTREEMADLSDEDLFKEA